MQDTGHRQPWLTTSFSGDFCFRPHEDVHCSDRPSHVLCDVVAADACGATADGLMKL